MRYQKTFALALVIFVSSVAPNSRWEQLTIQNNTGEWLCIESPSGLGTPSAKPTKSGFGRIPGSLISSWFYMQPGMEVGMNVLASTIRLSLKTTDKRGVHGTRNIVASLTPQLIPARSAPSPQGIVSIPEHYDFNAAIVVNDNTLQNITITGGMLQ